MIAGSFGVYAAVSARDHGRQELSGRRRQGKTYLLDAAATTFGGFYFAATDSTEADSLASFGRALASFGDPESGGSAGGRYRRVPLPDDGQPSAALADPACARSARVRAAEHGAAPAVRFRDVGNGEPARWKRAIARPGQPGDDHPAVRLSGRGGVLGCQRSSPGCTGPFDRGRVPCVPAGIRGGRLPRLASRLRRLGAANGPQSATAALPQLPLFREARYLLAEESDIRDTAIYHAVLGAIASGNATRGGIASHIGRKSPDTGHPLAVLEDSQLITRETDPFRKGRSLYRITEPLIVCYEAVMRREWTRLERGDTAGAWRNSQATFLTQVVGPHYESICRDWAPSAGDDVFGSAPGEVAAGVVADPLRRSQIEIDVTVFAPDDTGRPRRVLSLGEVTWDKVMNVGHLDRLRGARDLLAVKGYDTSGTKLTCYRRAGFHPELAGLAADAPVILLVGWDMLYA